MWHRVLREVLTVLGALSLSSQVLKQHNALPPGVEV